MIVLLLILSLVGCLDFGKDEETASPIKAQVARCRSEMFLNPSMNITPLGFKLEGSGIDDAIWFKFKTNVVDVQEIFDDDADHNNFLQRPTIRHALVPIIAL